MSNSLRQQLEETFKYPNQEEQIDAILNVFEEALPELKITEASDGAILHNFAGYNTAIYDTKLLITEAKKQV